MNHHFFMSRALQLAAFGRATVAPNPMVGCVIVKNNQIVGEGYHVSPGGPHAEIIALNQAKTASYGATVYVTLEPCCHYGRTPPCSNALIAAGIEKIYVACNDSNPLVNQKSIEQLRAAGIIVEVGLLALDAKILNEVYFHFIRTKRPFIVAKWAMTLNGKMKFTQKRILSCPASQFHTHQLRHFYDAILIGANTLRMDNPQLTVRYNLLDVAKNPIRIILAGKQKLPPHLQVFKKHDASKTIIIVSEQHAKQHLTLKNEHVEILILPDSYNLSTVLDCLGKMQITSILVEGGMHVLTQFFQQQLVNKTQVYVTPYFSDEHDNMYSLPIRNLQQLGIDFSFTTDEIN